jgi:hypothetical protein
MVTIIDARKTFGAEGEELDGRPGLRGLDWAHVAGSGPGALGGMGPIPRRDIEHALERGNAVNCRAADCALAHAGGLQNTDQHGDLFDEISEICSDRVENIGCSKIERCTNTIAKTDAVWPTSSTFLDHFDPLSTGCSGRAACATQHVVE